MKSFLKSLPSHRKKEKSRKARKSRGSAGGGCGEQKIKIECAKFVDQTGELNLDSRRDDTDSAIKFSGVKQSQCSESDVMSALTDEGSFVAGTQLRTQSRNSIMMDDNDNVDTPGNIFPPQQSALSAVLPKNDIHLDASETSCPSVAQKCNDINKTEETIVDFDIDLQRKEVEKRMKDSLDGSFTKDRIPNMESNTTQLAPQFLSGNNEPSKLVAPNVEDRVGEKILTATGDAMAPLQEKERNGQQQRQRQQVDELSIEETQMSLELLKRPDSNVAKSSNQQSPSHLEHPSRMKTSQQKEQIKPTPMEQQQVNNCLPHSDFVLSLADIRQCITEVDFAKELAKTDVTLFNVDVERFHSCLEQFEKYVCALCDESSAEAKELQIVGSDEDKAFQIFDRGMNIDHCNVMFIRDVICTISSGIDDQKRSSLSPSSHISSNGEHKRKLDHFASGLDFVFGISGGVESESSPPKIGVAICNTFADKGLELKFTTMSHSAKISKHTDQQSSLIPSHLSEISDIFARFAANETRTLQSQLDTTRLALSKLRSHAMSLQAQALKATDHALHVEDEIKYVREQCEVEISNLQSKYDTQKRIQEQKIEGYKMDLKRKQLEVDQLKDRYENELKQANDELIFLRSRQSDKMVKRGIQCDDNLNDASSGKQYAMNGHRGTDFSRDRNSANGNVRNSNRFPLPHQRNTEYKSSSPVDESDAKRRKTTNRAALKSCPVNVFSAQSPGNASPKKSTSITNPYKKETRTKVNEDGKPSFAYKEVVRKRAERSCLPAHDCEECKKFFDALEALGGNIDRDEIINNCSRHRARHKPGKRHHAQSLSSNFHTFVHPALI